ncbi:phage tail tape measure protein [Lysinibacillus sp. NPDC093712]|uniref:phage tail tape measure protein n=1 Tax=Lysinibacillus sp. NPDC093712 TaxID=3390579 RepID=UPI003D06C56C
MSKALDAYIEFARQGYKGDELGTLADAGLIASNVGEITAQSASEYLTSSLVQWKMEAKDAMKIIDSLNNVSNNYATTTEKVFRGLARSSATAKAMNLDFDQTTAIIGTLTASTKQSGDEIGNFLKNVLPRLVSDKAQSTLSGLGISLEDEFGNLRDVVEVYSEVAEKVKGISDIEKIAVTEGLAGKYHISRMQAFLDDLGSADSMYRSMYETSKNSAGSASRENEIYMRSLEARISLARVEVEKLAVSIGDAFLTDGMIAFLQGTASFLEVMTKTVGVIGALPIALGLGSTALLLMSTRARTLATDMLLVGTTFTKASIQSKSLSGGILAVKTASEATTASTARLGIALKGLIASTGIGLAFVAVGIVLEKIISAMGNARQKAEELESANKEMLNSYGQNADKIDELVNRYEELNKVQQNGELDNTQLAEYRDIQNEIATLMPSLVTGEDKYGNKLIGSAEYIRIKTDLLKEHLAVEKEKAQLEESNTRKDRISANEDSMKDSKDDVKKTLGMFTNDALGTNLEHMIDAEYKIKFVDEKGNPLLKTTDDLSKQLVDIQEKRKLAETNGNTEVVNYYKSLEKYAENYLKKLYESDIAIRQSSSSLKSDYLNSLEQVISKQGELSDSAKQSANELVASLISASDPNNVVKLHDTLSAIFGDINANELTEDVISSFDNLNKATSENFDEMATKTKISIGALKKALSKDGTLTDTQINAVIKALNNELSSTKDEFSKLSPEVKGTSKTLAEMKALARESSEEVDGLGESASQLPEVLQKQIDKLKDLSSVQEQIVGISEAQVKAISDSITVIEFLGNVSERTEQQELSLANSLELLSALYPQLTNLLKGTSKQREQAIGIINSENKANQALLKAYELSAQGKMNAEGRATIAHLEETNRRINNINAEIRALDTLQANYNKIINSMSKDKGVMTDADYLRQEKLAQQANNKVALRQAELATLSGTQSTYATSLSNTNKALEENDKSTNKSNSSQKDSNKTTKDSIYVTDEYKASLEALNLEIEKQVKLQSTLPEHSDGYKQSLETQIKLEKDKLALIEKQAKALQSQIASGKIKQTGTVSSTTQVSSSSNGKIHGADGRITSMQTARKNPITGKNETHRGIDIAQPLGSRIDAFYKGEVVKAGFHNSYGNVVRVKDENNLEHIYAHLSKISVKVGDIVEAGAKIGEAGSTGDSTGSHLHYEVNNASGKVLDASPYFNPIRNGTKKAGTETSSSGVSTVDNTQQAIDQAKSDLNGLYGDILDQEEKISNLERRAIDTSLASYEFKKSNYDKFLENSDNRLNKLTKSSQAYRDELVRASNALNAKKDINKAEIEQLKQFINSGTLSAKVVEEYTDRLHELGKINSEIDFSLKDLDNSKLESYSELVEEITSNYDKQRSIKDSSIEYNTLLLEELDKSSISYLKSLDKIKATMLEKQNINRYELNSLEQLITNGKLYGDALDKAKNRVNELNKEIKQLQLDIQEGNFNIIVNIKTQSDAKIDDMQFELDRSDAIRKMFEEGSADYANYTKKMIEISKQMADQHLKTRGDLIEELKLQDISIERRKEILESIEDEHLAYLNATLAIKDYNKQLKDSIENQRKDIANNVINALKEAYQEYRDERMKILDEEIERENEKHNQIMKQLNDEMNLYRKNIEEKLRLIDRQEAERDYNMEIDDMEKERSKIQSQINLLSLDNSNEAKSKRKKLQEQLDKIDKDIAEKRHDRDIELQKQGLNDLLESKEDEINGKIDAQDKEHEAVLKAIERQKKYWEKHYSDLLNDERKFAQIREDIMNGHFDKVQAELQQHINDLTATMPQLADTMDGTMQAVGMAIRQNIIDNLDEAMKMIKDFNSMQISSGGFNDGLGSSGGIGSIVDGSGSSNSSGGQSSQSKLVSDADLKVIMAKYMTDVLASQYNDVRANNIREKAHILAKEGRAQGSAIEANSHYNTELAKLSKEDQIRLSNIASSNYNVFESTEMQNAIKRWASSLKSRASALSGGMTSWSSNGIDGKGGKEMIVHPNELINSPLDTKNLLDMSNVMQRATQFFTPVLKTMTKPASLMSNISNSSGGDTYEINFTGNINNTSKDGAKQFATNIMNEIRTKKGGKF